MQINMVYWVERGDGCSADSAQMFCHQFLTLWYRFTISRSPMYTAQQKKVIIVLNDWYYNMWESYSNKFWIMGCSNQLIKFMQPFCIDTIICMSRVGYVQVGSGHKSENSFAAYINMWWWTRCLFFILMKHFESNSVPKSMTHVIKRHGPFVAFYFYCN